MKRSAEACALALVSFLIMASLSGAVGADVPTQTPVFSNPLNITNSFMPFQPGGIKVFQGESEGTKKRNQNQGKYRAVFGYGE